MPVSYSNEVIDHVGVPASPLGHGEAVEDGNTGAVGTADPLSCSYQVLCVSSRSYTGQVAKRVDKDD